MSIKCLNVFSAALNIHPYFSQFVAFFFSFDLLFHSLIKVMNHTTILSTHNSDSQTI